MKPPPRLKSWVGRPVVTAPILAACFYCLYVWYLHPDATLLGIVALGVMGWTLDANAKVARYRAWKRAWDAMGPGGATRRAGEKPAVQVGAFLALMAGAAFLLHQQEDQPGVRLAEAWLGAGLALLMLVAVFHFGRRAIRLFSGSRRQPDTSHAIVASCIRGPVMPVPSLKNAYGALPAHCWRVLGVPGAGAR